jgi:nitrogen fixation/metabolism regulation signal transduction histidine kinase
MSHFARKKTFVDPKVQGALVRRLVLHWFSFIAVAAVVAFCLQILTNPFRSISEHGQELWWTHGPFLLVMFFMLPVFIVDTIKLSNRFAGPIYRLRNTIRSVADGEKFQPLRFRDFDFWQGLADDFNAMVARLTGSTREQPTLDADETLAETESPTTDAALTIN